MLIRCLGSALAGYCIYQYTMDNLSDLKYVKPLAIIGGIAGTIITAAMGFKPMFYGNGIIV